MRATSGQLPYEALVWVQQIPSSEGVCATRRAVPNVGVGAHNRTAQSKPPRDSRCDLPQLASRPGEVRNPPHCGQRRTCGLETRNGSRPQTLRGEGQRIDEQSLPSDSAPQCPVSVELPCGSTKAP